MTFHLSPEIDLPPSAVTSTFAYLGIRGYGKSYAAGVQVEDFLAAGAQVVVVDPVGIWWGLRLSATGKRPSGFDVPVFGGTHGDLPLEPTGGELVARIAAEQRRSMVLDVSDWTLGEQRRFVTAFATLLFQLKKTNRSPIHLVFEEAHEFFPQFVEGASAPLVGATNRLWKIGRNYGIGGTLISQRAAEVNKSALNLTETLVTTRLKAPEDVKRIDGWVNANGAGNKAIALLPDLPKHQVIVWTDAGAVITKYRSKDTFDAGRTPEAGEQLAPTELPPLDVAAIREAMAATIEEAKANDPKTLRDEIARLRAELATAPGRHEMVAQISQDAVTLAAERDQWRDHCRKTESRLKELRQEFEAATPAEIRRLRLMESSFNQVIEATENYQSWNRKQLEARRAPEAAAIGPFTLAPEATSDADHADLMNGRPITNAAAPPLPAEGDGSMRMLRALAARHPTPLTEQQVSVLAGMKRTGGTYRTYRGKLTGQNLITRDGQFLRITDAGLKTAGKVDRPATGAEMLALWLPKFSGKARDLLEFFAHNGRLAVNKGDALRRVGLDPAGGTARTYWGQINGCGLIERAASGWRAVDSLVVR